jgi:XTP/dITP diphosphohydrolase
MTTLVLATRNRHKVEEIRAILGDGFHYLTLDDFPAAPVTIEDASTFAGNAAKKAVDLAAWLGTNRDIFPAGQEGGKVLVLADDSGLEVDALNGAPGVHSARFAALDTGASGNSPDGANNAKLLCLLHGVPPERRGARFRCLIALATVSADGEASPVEFFDGACEGQILEAGRGKTGFGYDPLFVPDGATQTFAELAGGVKNRISHRSRALGKLAEALRHGGR